MRLLANDKRLLSLPYRHWIGLPRKSDHRPRKRRAQARSPWKPPPIACCSIAAPDGSFRCAGKNAPEVELLATSPDHPSFAIRYFDKDRSDHLLDSRNVKGMSIDCSGPAEDRTLMLSLLGRGRFRLGRRAGRPHLDARPLQPLVGLRAKRSRPVDRRRAVPFRRGAAGPRRHAGAADLPRIYPQGANLPSTARRRHRRLAPDG